MTTQQVLPILIAGEWRLGGGDRYATRYPATGEVVAELNAASLADVEQAIQGADHAFRTSGWARRKPHERAAVLHRVGHTPHRLTRLSHVPRRIRPRAEARAQTARCERDHRAPH